MFRNKDEEPRDDDFQKEGGKEGGDDMDKYIIKIIRALPGLTYLCYTFKTCRYKGYRPFAFLLLSNAFSENIDNIILIYE